MIHIRIYTALFLLCNSRIFIHHNKHAWMHGDVKLISRVEQPNVFRLQRLQTLMFENLLRYFIENCLRYFGEAPALIKFKHGKYPQLFHSDIISGYLQSFKEHIIYSKRHTHTHNDIRILSHALCIF